jgi:hypothetical protein
MSRHSVQRVEEELRSGVAGARREPSLAFRTKVRAALGSSAPRIVLAPIAEPTGWAAWSGRLRGVSVAASVLVALGFWIYAFAGGFGNGESGTLADRSRAGAPAATPTSTTSGVLAQLVRATPQRLSIAVDGSLLSELDRMAQDATRAARFLVGRVPEPLVRRGTGIDSR